MRPSALENRPHQARHEWGLKIENRTEIVDGKKRSWFRLVEPPAESLSLFGEGER